MELVSTISNAKVPDERVRRQTKITDVNIDCLEEIFKYLELQDLLNVADSNKRLRIAASFEFAYTYQPKIQIEYYKREYVWRLAYYRRNNAADSELMEKLETGQQLDSLKPCFQLFRCFGSHITFLRITNVNEYDHFDFSKPLSRSYITAYERLWSRANESCHGSLKEIHAYGCIKGDFDQLKKPFLKVETLKANHHILNRSLWNVLFPQLRDLDIRHHPEFPKSSMHGIETDFPHLERLCVNDEKTDMCTILRLNPQIRALQLLTAPDLNTLQTMARLPALEELKLTISEEFDQILQHNRIHFGNVKTFYLYNYPYLNKVTRQRYKFPPEFDFPLTFDQITTFSCHCDIFGSAETLHKFLKGHPKIVKLRLWKNDINLVSPSEFANILPLLEDIEILDSVYNLEKVVELANEIKTLRMISFRTIGPWVDLNYLTSRMRLKDIPVFEYIRYKVNRVRILIA